MTFSRIQGTPPQISLLYVPADSAPPPIAHPLGETSGSLLLDILLAELPTSAQNALNQFLETPLDQLFDSAWQEMSANAQAMVVQAIQGAIPTAYNINVSFPTVGTLQAQVGPLSAGMLGALPSGTGSQLTFEYLLPGVTASFSEHASGIWGGWADPTYSLSFDATFELAVGVPSQTAIPLVPKAQFMTANMQVWPTNAYAVVTGIVNLIIAWLNDQPGGVGSALEDRIIAIDIPSIQQLLSELSSGFAIASQYGFLGLAVQINPSPPSGTPTGNTVEFDVTHAFDPGPTVTNASVMPPGVPTLLTAQIVPNVPQVNAGGTLGVTGTQFPAAQATQLAITWLDTTSGSVSRSEVQWGLSSDGQASPATDVEIGRTGPSDNANVFTVGTDGQPLIPSTSYAFRVRDYDVDNLVATAWGPWASLMTTPTDEVELVLDYESTTVGTTTLEPGGGFSTTIEVPASVPPGTYALRAMLSGHELAQTTITVIAEHDELPANLQFVDPGNGVPYGGTVLLVVPTQATVAGTNFRPGHVGLFIDSASGTMLGETTAGFDGSFSFTLAWPPYVVGAHSVWAQQAADHAYAPLYAEMPAK